MKKIKSYTGIWNVEKVLYAINDFNLPFPVTFTQITWFVITEFIIILFSLVLFFGVLISADSDDENSNFSSGITGMNLSAEVLKHQPMVEKYARENGISEYVNVLLAIIQVESGGTAEDVMQSSESLGLPPNSLDTESSIKQGCKYFASLLSSCQNQGIDDLNVAIQSYNYGGGYVGYVAGKGKKHTFNLAESFAREKSGGKKVTYTNPIAVAKNGGWRYGYGNMFYVELVNQYLTVSQVSGELAQKVMNIADVLPKPKEFQNEAYYYALKKACKSMNDIVNIG